MDELPLTDGFMFFEAISNIVKMESPPKGESELKLQ